MAKKKPASKKTAKRTSKKAGVPAAAKKAASKKPASKKKTTKKPSGKKTSAKAPASKKAPAKKTTSKKTTTKKTPTKPAAKPTSKKTESKPATKPASTKKAASTKPPASSKPESKTSEQKAPGDKGQPPAKDGKPNRKGITIVENRSRKKQAAAKYQPPPSTLGSLLNKRRRQPLIPSGPNAPASEFSRFGEDDANAKHSKKVKSPFKKRELDKFRETLLAKRRELAGDVEEMERGMAALGDRSGDPALDVAEQGSDAYDQSLSIGLAEADRKLIREIDDAIRRIEDGVYGICEVTHEPISIERLKELPWTRLSIEAARSAERHGARR